MIRFCAFTFKVCLKMNPKKKVLPKITMVITEFYAEFKIIDSDLKNAL